MEQIDLQSINKSHKNKVILQDVNLSIQAGTFVILRGASGAGKSTLLNLISGSERPTSGSIIIDGQDTSHFNEQERINFYRHTIGMVFQSTYLQPAISIFDNIALPGVFANVDKTTREQHAQELAIALRINDILNQLPSEVSGGQTERACIARALLMNPKIILADEPTNNLDPENAQNVLQILHNLCKQMRITIILASHSQEVLRYADRILEISNHIVRDVPICAS